MLKWACPTHLRPSLFNFCVHIKSVYLTILSIVCNHTRI
ncbi:unnamed protein product, partial [Brassica rapa subsp. trilocularis]